ncbi:MAG: DUF1501 domain-containing protein [Planctomycetaceae bacterium]|jgi:hypothetical protein|nr:DUF1501 domain-containing protein [Planctomycetaceae bacterium]
MSMHDHNCGCPQHGFSRRQLLQAGSAGMVGLGATGLSPLPAVAAPLSKAKRVLFVFLTGGISHHDTFDMKPAAPVKVRGEFDPVSTDVPGIQIGEHLPMFTKRMKHYAVVRSMGTGSNGHEQACHMMLTGRLDFPPAFSTRQVPSPNEWPSMLSVVTYAKRNEQRNLPPSAVLPEPSVNEAARVRPGQYAGRLGASYETWHVNVAAQCPLGNGACPDCFRFDLDSFDHATSTIFNTPELTLPRGGRNRLQNRIGLLGTVEQQRVDLQKRAAGRKLEQSRRQAITVLADPKTSQAFDVENADPKLIERYGKNKFGLSALMGYRLLDAGVDFVQVNLGKNSSWDTHRRNFVNLKRNLLPPFDRSMSALVDDLADSGLLDETLFVISGEFGRTPNINKNSGRDHWGPVFTALFAGGGVQGGQVIGQSDDLGAYSVSQRYMPENFSATIYDALGIPRDDHWTDLDRRVHEIYRGQPISALYG